MHEEITSPILIGTSDQPLAAAALGPRVGFSIPGRGRRNKWPESEKAQQTMKKYLFEAISGDGFLGLKFQLDSKLTEGNLQWFIWNRSRDCKIPDQGVSDNIHVRENCNIDILWCRRDWTPSSSSLVVSLRIAVRWEVCRGADAKFLD